MLGKRLINTGAAPSACTTDTLDLEGMPSGGETNVAVYKLDGNATDVTGNYNGNFVNAAYGVGKFGQAGVFNGSNTYMTIGNPIGSNVYSFSIWIKPTVALPSGIGAIIGGSGTTLTYYQHNNGSLLIYNGGSYLEATNFFQDTNWVHLVAVSNGSNILIYRNGALFATLGASITLNSITFGKHPLYGVEYFNGSLDQIRIFNKVLDSTEANTLYNETVATTSDLLFPNPSIVAYYKLDSTAADVTGNYDGTPTNVTYTNSGQFSQAAVFDGSSSIFYVNSFNTTTNFSISLWFKSSASSYQVLANNGGGEGANTGFNWLLIPSGQIQLLTSSGGGNFNGTPSSLSYNDGNWHNAVLNYASNGVYSIYVDNQPVVSETSSLYTGGAVAGRPFAIGAWSQLNQFYFNGSIDQVRIYNQPLSAANVETLFNEVQCPCTTDTVDYPTTNAAYYQLDNNPQDSTTNGYDGVASNVTYNTGKFGQAGVFNGSSSKIQLPQTYGAEGLTFTYSFWFNTSTNASSEIDEYIVSKRNGQNTFQIRIHTDGKIVINKWTGGVVNVDEVRSTSSYTDGDWHHFVFTYDSNATIKTICYIDGSRDTSMDWTSSLISQSINNGNVIGQIDVGGRAYTGSLDQFRIFDTALTADQVTDLYDEVYCVPLNILSFDTLLYDGGSTQTVSNNGFQPDLIWIKSRGGNYSHILFDSVIGIDQPNDFYLRPDITAGQVTTVDRFTLNDNTMTIPVGSNVINSSAGSPYVMWQWKAGGSTSTYNIDDIGYATASAAGLDSGTIIPTGASVNTATGFSIIKYKGTGGTGTVGHGLSSTPELIIRKNLATPLDWWVYAPSSPYFGYLNYADPFGSESNAAYSYNQTVPTDTVFSVANTYSGNINNDEHIAYCFHSVAGYQKVGSYAGGQALGVDSVIDFGFAPRFVIIKNITAATGWIMIDAVRPSGYALFANEPWAEGDYSSVFQLGSSGLTFFNTNNNVNAAGNNYIYLAIA